MNVSDKKDIGEILKKFPDIRQESLIPILQEVQDTIGFIDEEAIKKIGEHLKITTSKIYGVATFYNQFRFSPKGKYHIQLCYGTACHVVGSSTLLKEIEKLLKIKDGETTKDELFSLEVLTCIGGCGQAPVIAVNGDFYGKMDFDKMEQLIDSLKHNENISFK
jgi:NADH-quinone oxidoreductase E subunit